MRYRIARWLLGYRPVYLDGDGAFVVIKDGQTSLVIKAKSLDVTESFTPLSDVTRTQTYVAGRGRAGSFSGTF